MPSPSTYSKTVSVPTSPPATSAAGRKRRPSREGGAGTSDTADTMTPMSDAYAAAGVDTGQADRAVDALVGVLRRIEIDRPSASVLAGGHYASVLRVAPNLGIAMSTDGVGSKIVVAEQADRPRNGRTHCVPGERHA